MKLNKQDIEEITDIENPRGQILTSRYKKHVYIIRKGKYKGYIFKGPWVKNSDKVRNIIFRSECIKLMNDNNVLLPDIMEDYNENIWFRYKNLATKDENEWLTQQKQGKIENEPINVIIRESLGYKLLDNFDEDIKCDYLFGDHKLYNTYLLLAVLGVGDMGPWNVIVSNKKPFIIDIDDNSGRKSFDKPTNIFAKLNKKSFIKLINDHFDTNYHEIHEYLISLKNKLNDINKLSCKHLITTNINKNYNIIKSFFETHTKFVSKYSDSFLKNLAIDLDINISNTDNRNTIIKKLFEFNQLY